MDSKLSEFFWGMVAGIIVTAMLSSALLALRHENTTVIVPMPADAPAAIQQCDFLGDALGRTPEVLSNAEATVYWCELK